MPKTQDLLGGAGLLLAVLTFVYGLVYSTIDAALQLRLAGRNPIDAADDRERIRHVRRLALGTAVGALGLTAVFLPPVVTYGRHFVGVWSFHHYDPLKTALVIVELFFLGLAAHAGWSAWRLTQRHRALEGRAS